MVPGLRVRMPFGSVQVSTFARANGNSGFTYKIELIVQNDTTDGIKVDVRNFARLVANDVPYAPSSWSPRDCCGGPMSVQPESAEFVNYTFETRTRQGAVLIRLGEGKSQARTVLRWPT